MNHLHCCYLLAAFAISIPRSAVAQPPIIDTSSQPHPTVAYANARHETIVRQVANERELIDAKLKVALAKVDRKRYIEVESVQLRASLRDAIVLATKRNEQANERLRWSERLANRGLISQASLELDEAAAQRTTVELSNAHERLVAFTKTGYVSRLRELVAAVRTAQAQQQLIESTMADKLSELQTLEAAARDKAEEHAARPNHDVLLSVLHAAHRRAQTDLAAQKKFQESELQRASSAIEAAKRKLAEFESGEQGVDEQQNRIRAIAESLDAAQQQVAWSERVLRKGYVTPAELQTDRLTATEKSIELKSAQLQLKLIQDHAAPLTRAELKARVRISEHDHAHFEKLRDAAIARATAIAEVHHQAYQSALARRGDASGDAVGAGGE